jgi:hypothetical protein
VGGACGDHNRKRVDIHASKINQITNKLNEKKWDKYLFVCLFVRFVLKLNDKYSMLI